MTQRFFMWMFASLGCVAIPCSSVQAQCFETALLGADLDMSDTSGNAVCIDGDVAIVGAKNKDDLGTDTGAAYIFERNAGVWAQTAKLVPLDLAAGHFLGDAVCVLGDWAVAGASEDSFAGVNTGSAYVFRREVGGWTEFQKIQASGASAGDQFACALAMDGNRLLIGSRGSDDFVSNSGAAYLYEFDGTQWNEVHVFYASDPTPGSVFGFDVAIDGGHALISSQNSDEFGSNSGSAYFFELDQGVWTEAKKVTASTPDAGDQFGRVVVLNGDTALVGTENDDDLGTNAGAVYAFERVNGVWTETQKFFASDGDAGDQFSRELAMQADIAVVGSFRDDDMGTDAGAAYIFRRVNGQWIEGEKLLVPGGQPVDAFGRAVGLSGDSVLVGAALYDGAALNAGGAFVYSIAAAPTYCTAKMASDGCLPSIGAFGLTSLATPMEFTLSCIAPANRPGIAFFGFNGRATIPFFNATLCMNPPLVRGPILFNGTTAGLDCPVSSTGLGTFEFEFNAWNQSNSNFGIGQQLQAQFWFRDPQQIDGTGVGLSNAVEFEVCP